jgi:hypothetical protein
MRVNPYSHGVYWLTRREQLVLCLIVGLLLVGWAVKAWRTAHPPTASHEHVDLK